MIKSMKCKQSRRRLHKYIYTIDDKTYFIILAERDRASYEARHGVSLELWEDVKEQEHD